jgi:hypothetical protein
MRPEGAEGLAAVNPVSPASPRLGWDPYEVWRTRVKEIYSVTQERAGVGTRPSLQGATQTAYRFIRSALEPSGGYVRQRAD